MIAVSALDLPARQGTDYPRPHDAPCLNRIRRALGDVFGLAAEEVAYYSDIDKMVREDASTGGYFTKDGRPLK